METTHRIGFNSSHRMIYKFIIQPKNTGRYSGVEGVSFGESSSDDERQKIRQILILGRGARVVDIPLQKVLTFLSLLH